MPLHTPTRQLLLSRRGLALSAALCLALAAGLRLPALLGCLLTVGDRACHVLSVLSLRSWFAWATVLWVVWLGAALTHDWLPQDPVRRRWALAMQIVGLAVGLMLLFALLGRLGGPRVDIHLYVLQVHAIFAACACLALEYHQRGRRGLAEAARLRLNEQALAGQLDAARAALLQAQVEPHFLFNTLAHLRRLAHTDAAAARDMLGDLRRYLAAALPELRQPETPLARELELAAAFLALHQRRIGPARLQLRTEIAPGLEDVIVPSTCLLTLAENAIKHGIGPQVDGGEICVRARPDPDDADLLRLEVADTGAGMGESSGSGTGLATLRARLAAAYGSRARLSLHLNQPRGLVVRLQLPWR